jgi:hypothetical protein
MSHIAPSVKIGGAVSRVGNDESAFDGCSAGFTYNIGASTRGRDDPDNFFRINRNILPN